MTFFPAVVSPFRSYRRKHDIALVTFLLTVIACGIFGMYLRSLERQHFEQEISGEIQQINSYLSESENRQASEDMRLKLRSMLNGVESRILIKARK